MRTLIVMLLLTFATGCDSAEENVLEGTDRATSLTFTEGGAVTDLLAEGDRSSWSWARSTATRARSKGASLHLTSRFQSPCRPAGDPVPLGDGRGGRAASGRGV